jgi:hypothetical protein
MGMSMFILKINISTENEKADHSMLSSNANKTNKIKNKKTLEQN